ncbi:MAG: RluA family pseudouridine synthase [Bacteroidales bacterium]|nr:RluA family pseudouridine synthase [Candidatus Hennigimonas equi]
MIDDYEIEEIASAELDGDQEQEMFEHFRYEALGRQDPIRIDKYLAGQMEGTSRSRIQLAIKAGFVRVNDKTVKANYIVRPRDIITFVMPYRRRGTEILPENIPLDIPFEDEQLLIINKPAGMVVHPGHGHYSGTLVNALAYHLGMRQEADEGDERMGMLVHRIDKDTSGLLVVSKTDEAQAHLAKQFFVHSIERKYIAVVWGNLPEDEGTIEGNIGRDPSDRLKFKVFPEGDQGKTAVTHYKVIERFGFVTVVQCILETGRTHQIRVHMSHIGHPLFGDERYGGTTINKGTIYAKYRQFIQNCFKICPRQALHAAVLGFEHPSSGRHVHFETPMPADMTSLIEKWRMYAGNMPSED